MIKAVRIFSTALGAVTALAGVTLLYTLLASGIIAAPAETQDVRNVVAGFAATWNRHDMDAFGKLFAPDAEFVSVAGALWTGRQSIEAQHAYSHGTVPADSPVFSAEDRPYYGIFKNSTAKFDQIDIRFRFLRKDVAIAHVSWQLMGDTRT